MQALARHVAQPHVNAEIAMVISDQNTKGLNIAAQMGIPTHAIIRNEYSSQQQHEDAICSALKTAKIDAIFLVGYMQILSKNFCTIYQNMLFNIHPSLLPRHKGINTHYRAIAAGNKLHGCTIHRVTSQLDSGEILMQKAIPILPNDSEETLAERVLAEEHKLYPAFLDSLIKDQHKNNPGLAITH